MVKHLAISKETCDYMDTLLVTALYEIKNLDGTSEEEKIKLRDCCNKFLKFFDLYGENPDSIMLTFETMYKPEQVQQQLLK